jgi:hypothetical protein
MKTTLFAAATALLAAGPAVAGTGPDLFGVDMLAPAETFLVTNHAALDVAFIEIRTMDGTGQFFFGPARGDTVEVGLSGLGCVGDVRVVFVDGSEVRASGVGLCYGIAHVTEENIESYQFWNDIYDQWSI